MSFDPKGYTLSVEDGTHLWFLGTRMAVKAGRCADRRRLHIPRVDGTGRLRATIARHDRGDEAFYLIDGIIEVTCGDKQWTVGPGGFVLLPRGIPHSFVVSAGPVRGLQITTPADFERFIDELGTVPNRDSGRWSWLSGGPGRSWAAWSPAVVR